MDYECLCFCVVAENTYLKLKPPQSAAKADNCCSPPSLTVNSHLSPGNKRSMAPNPGKFDFSADKPPFVSSPYENTTIPSPSDSVCSSASGKESASSAASFKDGGPGPEYEAAAGSELYPHMER